MSLIFAYIREFMYEDLRIQRDSTCVTCHQMKKLVVRPAYCSNKTHMYCDKCEDNISCRVCKYFMELPKL